MESYSKAKEHEKEEEGDGDTLDSDEFCILDAPGLGIAVGWDWGSGCPALLELLGRRSSQKRRQNILYRQGAEEEGGR